MFKKKKKNRKQKRLRKQNKVQKNTVYQTGGGYESGDFDFLLDDSELIYNFSTITGENLSYLKELNIYLRTRVSEQGIEDVFDQEIIPIYYEEFLNLKVL